MTNDPSQPRKWSVRTSALVAVLALGSFAAFVLSGRLGGPEEIPYSAFLERLAAGEVSEVVVSGDRILGRFTDPYGGRFVTTRVEEDLATRLAAAQVEYAARPQTGPFARILALAFPFLFVIAIYLFLFRRLAGRGVGGLMSVGKSRAKIYVETDTRVSFDDVAGVDEAKEELTEVVEFLKDPTYYGRLGARMPRGVLLVGPPGTGKTLLARAVAGEAKVPFFSISGSEFVEMFVGVGAARVRDLFEQARAQAPCIIFVDELDALGRARGGMPGLGGGNDEKDQTLNQLLVEMDGFDAASGIVLLAATNRPEVLDAALLRAGRFDRQVLVDRPDRVGRAAVLEVHLKGVALAPEVNVLRIAELTPGFTGAELANLVNEAALVATRRGAAEIETRDFTTAVERIVAGLEKKNRLLNPKEREIVAHHEMGHAIVATALPGSDPVHKISIIPRGIGALGYTMQRPTEDRFLMTRQELENKMAVLLGGRAAEKIVYGHLSTGASDDLARASEIARSMVTRYAMVPELGNVTYSNERPNLLASASGQGAAPFGAETANRVDAAVRELVDAALSRAEELLHRNRSVLDDGAQRLLELETLDEGELTRVFASLQEPAEAA